MRVLAVGAGALLVLLAWDGSTRGVSAQTALSCTGSVVNVVGAHAGALSLRIGATIDCSAPANLDFTLPGGHRATFATDASGHFVGIVGEGYVCAGRDDRVAVLATAAAGGTSWLRSFTIGAEGGGPAPAGGFGRNCDVLLGPGLNYLAWGGPLVLVQQGFSAATLGVTLPRGDNPSSNPLDQIASVSAYDPVAGAWGVWLPGAPPAASSLRVLKPGLVYVVRSTADIELRYPVVAAP